LSSFGVLCLMLSVSLDSTFIVLVFCVVTSVLFVFVLCLVSKVFCVSGFYRTMTNKTEVTTQKTKTMKVESRDTENIRDKTRNEDKQNRSYNTEN
jgi:hypothetical protein